MRLNVHFVGTSPTIRGARAEADETMRPHRYLILVNGGLRDADREWLGALVIERQAETYTALRGDLDQSGLMGVLSLLRQLALEVFEVRRVCKCASPRQSCLTIEKRPLVAVQ
jgi:hypothetical protein